MNNSRNRSEVSAEGRWRPTVLMCFVAFHGSIVIDLCVCCFCCQVQEKDAAKSSSASQKRTGMAQHFLRVWRWWVYDFTQSSTWLGLRDLSKAVDYVAFTVRLWIITSWQRELLFFSHDHKQEPDFCSRLCISSIVKRIVFVCWNVWFAPPLDSL